MQFFSRIRFKIGQRIMGLVIILLVLMIGCFWYALYKMKHVGRELEEVVKEDFPLVNLVTQVTTHQLEQTVWLERALRYGEIVPAREKAKELLKNAKEEVKKKSLLVEEEIKKVRQIAEEAKKKVSTQEQQQAFKEIDEQLKAIEDQYVKYKKYITLLFEELSKGNIAQAEALAARIERESKELNKKLSEYEEKAEKFLDRSLEIADSHEQAAIKGLGIIGLIALVFGLSVGGFIARGITSKLRELIVRLKDLATGEADLTKQLAVKAINCSEVMGCGNIECPAYGKKAHCWYEAGSYAPEVYSAKIKSGAYSSCEMCKVYKLAISTELDEVSTFVNAFIRRIRDLVAKTKIRGEEVAEEARSLSSVAEQLASGAVEAQAQAEEVSRVANTTSESVSSVAAAMEEMTATVEEISRSTTQASEVAQEAKEEATKAQAVIQNLAHAAEQISEVSKLIGSIAEQTKLLSLNATIEAARAGEAGKGFSVVANEIKELAQQTGNSVTEIDEMLKDLQSGVTNALSAMNRISEVIEQVAEFSNNIAAAIEEQTATTNEVSANTQKVSTEVNDMVRMSETIAAAGNQTAQGAEHVKNTAHKLRELSDGLKRLLGEFKV